MSDTGPSTTEDSQRIPPAVLAWLEEALRGKVTHVERSVSRREGWLVDVEPEKGERLEGFLRLERFEAGNVKQPSCQVRQETAVIAALHAQGIPVPAVYAHSDALQATLFERAPGDDDVHQLADARQQREISIDFMRQLARVHAIPVGDLALPGLSPPASPEQFALAGIDELERMYAASVAVPDPLALLSFRWLRRNTPPPPARPVLVQGDTGPGNFVYVGNRVSAILDWECAHLGDPLEDLGHLYSRAFFHPWGDMRELLDVYVVETQEPIDKPKLHFYRVASFAKAALGSTAGVNYFQVAGPLPLLIFCSIAGERGLAQSLADALGVEVESAELPEPEPGLPAALSLPVEEISEHIVDNELLPELGTPYLRHRANELRQLARYQARRERHLSAVLAQELEELRELTSEPIASVQDGLVRLNALIEDWDEAQVGEIARYLTRRAQRAEALASPLAGRFTQLHSSPV